MNTLNSFLCSWTSQLLNIDSIHGTTTEKIFLKELNMSLIERTFDRKLKQLREVKIKEWLHLCKASEVDDGSKLLVLHCVIHQHFLCGKRIDMPEVLKPVVSVVNFIRSTGLNYRQFHGLTEETGENYLPYTAVC
ncbi:putative general transcription factor II-I repeat domain-containing protein [Trypoxylus dichotomus]